MTHPSRMLNLDMKAKFSLSLFLFCCFVFVIIEICKIAIVKFPSYYVFHHVVHRALNYFEQETSKDYQFMIYSIIHVFSWKLVYLTTVESYSHFCTLINLIIIICSIQYIQTNGRLRRLKKSSEGETKTLGNFDSSYCTLLLETSPLIHSVNTSLMRKEKVYIYI